MKRSILKVPTTLRANDQLFALLLSVATIGCPVSSATANQSDVEEPLSTEMLAPMDPAVSASELASICESDASELRARIDSLSTLELEHYPLRYLQSVDSILANQHGRWMFALTLAFVHPDESTSNAARGCAESFSSIETRLFSSAEIYSRLMDVDLADASPETRRSISLLANRFRASGVGLAEEARDTAVEIREALGELEFQFIENIRSSDSFIEVPLDRLGGLPTDYIQSRYNSDTELVTISGRLVDSGPVLRYAEDVDLRFDALRLSKRIGYPENHPVLQRILLLRHELAELSGYSNFAELDMQGTMARSPDRVARYTQTLSELVKDAAQREADFLASFASGDQQELAEWDVPYLAARAQDRLATVDSGALRAYFPFDQTLDRVSDFVGTLLNIEFRRVEVRGWHEDVMAYEVLVDSQSRGRILLDMHPREGKVDGNQAVVLQVGIKDHSSPVIALICNFPRGDGELEIAEVRKLLHEFGHAVHFALSGNREFAITSSIGIEFDFLEAPSQLLELFLDDYETVKTLAASGSGAALPADVFNSLAAAEQVGRSLEMQRQLYLADLSLRLHLEFDSSSDLDELNADIERENRPFVRLVPDAHKYASFSHLSGYRSRFYAYDWSLAIAADLYSKFDSSEQLADLGVNYRRTVLERGASVPIDEALEQFLGRPVSFRTFANQLSERQQSLFDRIGD